MDWLQLLAIVGHELKTPLTAISGFGQLLAGASELADEDRQLIGQRIDAQARRLGRLVDDLLVAARVVAADRTAITDARAIAEEVAGETGMALAGDPVAIQVLGDPTWARIAPDALHQALGNLVINAVKHARDGSAVAVAISSAGQGRVRIAVTNLGAPIPLEDRERVFEPFVQLDASAARGPRGVGLGLSIVSKLVDAFGGTVGVDVMERGDVDAVVSFWIELAAAEAPQGQAEHQPSTAAVA